MWRKSEETKPAPDASSELRLQSTSSPQTAVGPAPGSSTAPVTVSQGIIIKGEISGQGDLVLDGTFEGKVHLPDGSFTAGPHAHVTAEIEAREIVVLGEVVGTLKARERVHISSTGKLTGDMDTRGIVIEDGAILHSKVATPRAASSQPASRKSETPQITGSNALAETPKEEPPRTMGAAAGDS